MYVPFNLNDSNENIQKLNSMLKKLHYPIREVTNNFSDNTQRAVKSFQNDFGLKVTGIVDENTWNIIEKASEKSKTENIETVITTSKEEMIVEENKDINMKNNEVIDTTINNEENDETPNIPINNNTSDEMRNNKISNELIDEITKILMNNY